MDEFILRLATGIPGFLLAIVVHELAHAYMAYRYGDSTALMSGRMTFNPSAHMDPLGTVALPLIGAAMGGVMFGWAKPVPVNPARFKNYRQGLFWVSFAGPIANFLLAFICIIAFAFVVTKVSASFYFYDVVTQMLYSAILINIVIGGFNLIPFPPLDGSKMVMSFLDYETSRRYEELQRFFMIFILVIWMTPILGFVIGPMIGVGNLFMNMFVQLFS